MSCTRAFLQEEEAPEMAFLGDSPIAQWQIRQVEEVAIERQFNQLDTDS